MHGFVSAPSYLLHPCLRAWCSELASNELQKKWPILCIFVAGGRGQNFTSCRADKLTYWRETTVICIFAEFLRVRLTSSLDPLFVSQPLKAPHQWLINPVSVLEA